jgi:hypothetical protein
MTFSLDGAGSAAIGAISGLGLSFGAAYSIEPFALVFSTQAAVLAICGALGGSTLGLALKRPWREFFSLATLGALLAFGAGTLAPKIIGMLRPDLPEIVTADLPTLASAAYFIGLLQNVLIARLIASKTEGKP